MATHSALENTMNGGDGVYPSRSRSSSEKEQMAHYDKHTVPAPPPTFDEKILSKAMLKLDCFLLTTVTLMYLLNFLDRANIGNAKVAGLTEALHMNSTQYSIALTVTYIPYIIAEFPITMLIKILGPNILIPILVCSWGLVTTLQGLVTSYSGLLAARFFLGACEGALLPSSMAYLSMFYRRKDLAKRVAFFFTATSLAGAFAGLLAAGLLHMDGLGGRPGWAWIFIIEGLLTVVCGVAAYFILSRSPATTHYLTAEEKKHLIAALDADRPAAEEHGKITAREVLSAFKSPHMWLMCIQLFASGTLLFSMAYFAPTIVGGLGYKGTKVQLMSVPPYAVSTVFSLFSCYMSDRMANRGLFAILAGLISAAGYLMFLVSTDKHVLYGALFMMIIGAYTSAPILSTWMPNNLAPFYRRTTGIVMGFVFTNCGGILSTWLFPAKQAPRFHTGTSVLLGLSLCIPVFAVLNMAYIMFENKRRARLLDDGHTDDVDDGQLGDRSVHFKLIM